MTFGFDRVVVRVVGISITSSRDWDLIYVAPGIAIAAEFLRRFDLDSSSRCNAVGQAAGASFYPFNSARREWTNRDLLRSIDRGGASYGTSICGNCVEQS